MVKLLNLRKVRIVRVLFFINTKKKNTKIPWRE